MKYFFAISFYLLCLKMIIISSEDFSFSREIKFKSRSAGKQPYIQYMHNVKLVLDFVYLYIWLIDFSQSTGKNSISLKKENISSIG